jgi:hypothetical protein
MKLSLPAKISGEVSAAAETWSRQGKTATLWNRDKSLWTSADEDKWLGWLDIADRQLGYIQMNPEHEAILQRMRLSVHDHKRVATCLGFGPRFLHSTGQAYKGGPNTGVFLQITCDDAHDRPIHGQKFTFGTVKAAQSRGDFDVLADLKTGLATLEAAIMEALN